VAGIKQLCGARRCVGGPTGQAGSGIACLDVLAAQMRARGWTAYITTPAGRLASLFVQDPHDRAECGDIIAARDTATGQWWYWFSWAERIGPAHAPAAAADAIISAFQRPRDDSPEPEPEPSRHPASGHPPPSRRPAPHRLPPAGFRPSSREARPRSPSRTFWPGEDMGAAWHARKRRNRQVTPEHARHRSARQHPDSVTVGVEEEFHTVGLRTRAGMDRSPWVMLRLQTPQCLNPTTRQTGIRGTTRVRDQISETNAGHEPDSPGQRQSVVGRRAAAEPLAGSDRIRCDTEQIH
jgi:hypothetical protein